MKPTFWCRLTQYPQDDFTEVEAYDWEDAATDFMESVDNNGGGEWSDSMMRNGEAVSIDMYKDGEEDKVYRVAVEAEAVVRFYIMQNPKLLDAA